MSKILSQRNEKWGIDADVLIVDSQGIEHIVTMRFTSEDQILKELAIREKQAISAHDAAYQETLTAINEKAVQEKLDVLFESKASVTKEEYESIKTSTAKSTSEVKKIEA